MLRQLALQGCRQFDKPRFIVDSYTGASRDMLKLVLNTDYGTATLRPEAFELSTPYSTSERYE